MDFGKEITFLIGILIFIALVGAIFGIPGCEDFKFM